jgi:hypothetical protein
MAQIVLSEGTAPATPSTGTVAVYAKTDGKVYAKDDAGTESDLSAGLTDGDKGDITVASSGASMTIDNDVVTNAKLANVSTATIKGRTTAGSGDPEDLTATQATALLDAMVGDSGAGGTKGLVPAPAAGDAAANKFLKANGTWTAPSGSGDVVGPASSVASEIVLFDGTTGKLIKSATTTGIIKASSGVISAAASGTDYVAPGSVTTDGITMNTARLLGGTTASAGAVEEITVGSGLSLSAGSLTATGGSGGKLGTKGVGVLKAGGINLTQNDDRWLGSIGEASAASADHHFVMAANAKVSGLRVKLSAAVAGGESIVITAQLNDVDTVLTCTVTAGNTTASDTTHSFDANEGERISFKATTSATFGSTTDLGLSIVLTGEDGSGVGVIPYRGQAGTTFEFTESGTAAAVSLSSILTDLNMPGCKLLFKNILISTGSLNIRRNDVATGTSWHIQENEHRTFDADDIYNVLGSVGGEFAGVAIVAADADYYAPCFQVFTSYGQTQNTTRYAAGYGSGDASATESDVQFPMPACTVKNLRVCSNTVVAAGQNAVITIRKNGANTGVTCTLTNASRISSDLTNSVAFAAGDLMTVSVVSSATAGTHTYNILVETEETP